MNEPKRPIEELQLVVLDTNALAVQDAERAALVATLQPIALSITPAERYAANLIIGSKEEADAAAAQREIFIANAEKAETAINAYGNGMISRLFALHRRWTGGRGEIVDPLKSAAKIVKAKIISYQELEAEKARKEQARLQAIEDERVRKEQERLNAKADKLKTPERQEQLREQAATIVPAVVRVAAPVASVKSQKRWKVTDASLADFVQAAAKDSSLLGYLTLETGKLERAKSANTMLSIPGISFSHVSV